MQTLIVNLSDRSYPIHVGAEIIERAGQLMQQAGLLGKVAIVTNPTVAQLYLDPIHGALSQAGFETTPVLLPDGEEHKTLKSLSTIYDRLVAERFERKSCVLALGGGVIGDLAGFAAATYLRGIPYVQVPTTLLAQVDSSVGGKTGVNHDAGKNLIGAFYQPKLVLIDVAALRSLPRRELVAGLAEVIKYGVICDRYLFELLEQNLEKILALDRELLTQIIVRSCENKVPRRRGRRARGRLPGRAQLWPHDRSRFRGRDRLPPISAWRSGGHRHGKSSCAFCAAGFL